jgi:hypothetical protein
VVERWPGLLQFDRSDKEAADNLLKALPLLASPLEAAAIRERRLDGFAAIDRLRGKQTDAAFVVRRVAALPASEQVREAIYDAINPSCHLQPGRSAAGRSAANMTPSRTLDRLPVKPAYRTAPFTVGRADLRAELERAPRALRCLPPRAGARVLDLARRALAVRQRDLDAFAWGNERDVWWVDDFDGRAYALIGMQPARRAPVAAVYGTLYLQNGVPVGYGQSDHVGRACALSFNLFDTFRGGEASHVLARLLAALRAVFGAASFSVEPYQLGQDNDEGIASGAWWFWFKHGFAPRDAEALNAVRAEQQRSARKPAHRSNEATLRTLARWHLYFELDPAQPTPLPPLADLGLRAAALLAARGDDRDAELARCVQQRRSVRAALGASAVTGRARCLAPVGAAAGAVARPAAVAAGRPSGDRQPHRRQGGAERARIRAAPGRARAAAKRAFGRAPLKAGEQVCICVTRTPPASRASMLTATPHAKST